MSEPLITDAELHELATMIQTQGSILARKALAELERLRGERDALESAWRSILARIDGDGGHAAEGKSVADNLERADRMIIELQSLLSGNFSANPADWRFTVQDMVDKEQRGRAAGWRLGMEEAAKICSCYGANKTIRRRLEEGPK